jgi:hypothetical protein
MSRHALQSSVSAGGRWVPAVLMLAVLLGKGTAFGQEGTAQPASEIAWGQNHVFPSVAKADGSNHSQWRSSLVITNPLSYPILVQFKDYVTGTALLDHSIPPATTETLDDLVGFLGLPDGVYAVNVFVRAASVDDLLLVPVVARTFRTNGDGSTMGTTLPEKSWGVRTHTVPFDIRPGSRKALYVLASGNAVFDIHWFGPAGPLLSQRGLDMQGLNRYPVPEGAAYAVVVNTVDHDVSGFTGEPEIFAYSTGTDVVSGDTTVLK